MLVNLDNYTVYGQMNIFDFLKPETLQKDLSRILKVGDMVGRIVLGECKIATVTKVEGLPNYPFYRTDSGGCYTYEEGLADIESLVIQAEEERKKYKTIIPENLEERMTFEYKPRDNYGCKHWAQIGIYQGMLFWKEDITYQFLVPFEDRKALMKEYRNVKKRIMERDCSITEHEKPMRRLYWSRHGFYADAEYVKFNG